MVPVPKFHSPTCSNLKSIQVEFNFSINVSPSHCCITAGITKSHHLRFCITVGITPSVVHSCCTIGNSCQHPCHFRPQLPFGNTAVGMPQLTTLGKYGYSKRSRTQRMKTVLPTPSPDRNNLWSSEIASLGLCGWRHALPGASV